ncbi:GDP-mannose 4,6-dehydratase [Gammaproteobacteria bacterium]
MIYWSSGVFLFPHRVKTPGCSEYQPKDGSYLAELLLSKGYEVYGLIRRTSHFNRDNIDHIKSKDFHLYYGDLEDTSSLCHLMKDIRPDEVYHLASMSHVQISNDIPEYTFDTNAQGTVRLLEAIRLADINPCVYNAATSELFGGSNGFLNEESVMHPKSPYAISKLYSYWMMRYYRDAYGLYTWNGILFNHESSRRGENFITRKITLSLARILAGKQSFLEVGNTEAKRDWGYAPDYVEAMWMMLQSSKPDDYVVATGETHSVQEFIDRACGLAGLDPGKIVRVNPCYVRPMDVDCLCGDASKARRVLFWEPTVKFDELVRIMLKADMQRLKQ